jgi:hypothetical protein
MFSQALQVTQSELNRSGLDGTIRRIPVYGNMYEQGVDAATRLAVQGDKYSRDLQSGYDSRPDWVRQVNGEDIIHRQVQSAKRDLLGKGAFTIDNQPIGNSDGTRNTNYRGPRHVSAYGGSELNTTSIRKIFSIIFVISLILLLVLIFVDVDKILVKLIMLTIALLSVLGIYNITN